MKLNDRNPQNFSAELSAISASLQEILASHKEAYGEVFPHLFASEVATFIANAADSVFWEKFRAESISVLNYVSDSLIEIGGDDIDNVIGASFLENLLVEGVVPPRLAEIMPDKLAVAIKNILTWTLRGPARMR